MIRLLIVDPIRLTGSLLAAALEQQPDLHVNGYVTEAREALAQVQYSDIVLLNAMLPDRDLALARILQAVNPEVKVVLVGLPDSEEVIVDGIEAGMAGYVLREESIDELLTNVRAVYHGQVLISPAIAAMMMLHASRLAQIHQRHRLPEP
jgi:DNA-binding NarL/FixJ family response regulator